MLPFLQLGPSDYLNLGLTIGAVGVPLGAGFIHLYGDVQEIKGRLRTIEELIRAIARNDRRGGEDNK